MSLLARSKLGKLGLILLSGGREEVRSELGGLAHVALDLHLALHEGNLGVQLAETDSLKIAISHGERGISLSRLASLAGTLTVLEINLVDKSRLSTLLGGDLETKDSIDLRNKSLAMATVKVCRHHCEDTL